VGLVRYFTRLCTRSTPLGLFAGCSVGRISEETRLAVADRGQAQRHTRLGIDYLCALAAHLVRDPRSRGAIRWRTNSSAYEFAGQIRFVEAQPSNRGRVHFLQAVDSSPELTCLLATAQPGATLNELKARLLEQNPELSDPEIDHFLGDLIESQLLVSELQPAV